MKRILKESWQEQAPNWLRLARRPAAGGDHHWDFNLPRFLELLPSPGRQTVDIGCGEGRVARELRALGHRVIGVDQSAELVAAAAEADPASRYLVADAAALPLADSSADLAIAFMSLQDIDDLRGAIREIARILEPGGRFCAAILHPLRTAGRLAGGPGEERLVISESYFEPHPFMVSNEREGTTVEMWSEHRPLEHYLRALEDVGFLVEALREPVPGAELVERPGGISPKWRRLPLFLHWRARLAR